MQYYFFLFFFGVRALLPSAQEASECWATDSHVSRARLTHLYQNWQPAPPSKLSWLTLRGPKGWSADLMSFTAATCSPWAQVTQPPPMLQNHPPLKTTHLSGCKNSSLPPPTPLEDLRRRISKVIYDPDFSAAKRETLYQEDVAPWLGYLERLFQKTAVRLTSRLTRS
jgi:hypothetical protein